MRLFLDCEFNGFGGELISMALVSDAGDEFYEVMEIDEEFEPWVAEHVVPHLGKPAVFPEEFRAKLIQFLTNRQPLEIVVDWPSDAMYLMQALLGDDHTQTISLPMVVVIKTLEGDLPSETPHNALSDARAIRKVVMQLGLDKN